MIQHYRIFQKNKNNLPPYITILRRYCSAYVMKQRGRPLIFYTACFSGIPYGFSGEHDYIAFDEY